MAVSKRIAILNSAEALFAERGLVGASLRQIASTAKVDLSLVTYHFRTKDELFAAVIERRTRVFNREQISFLEKCERRAAPGKPTVEDVVHAYCFVFLSHAFSRNRPWRNFFHLYTRFSNDPGPGARIMSQYFDPISLRTIAALKAAVPDSSEEGIHWGFQFMSGALGECLVDTGSVQRLSGGKVDPEDMIGIHENLVKFISAGIRSLSRSSSQSAY